MVSRAIRVQGLLCQLMTLNELTPCSSDVLQRGLDVRVVCI